MKNDIYKSPQANLEPDVMLQAASPSPYQVSLWLVLASLGIGLLLAAIEFLFEKSLPGTSALTTVIPAMLIGTHYGGKRGVLFSSAFRHKVIGMWLLASTILGVVLIFALAPELFSSGMFASVTQPGLFLLIILIALLFAYVVSYLVFRSGEKTGIKQWHKKNLQGS